MKVAVLGPGGVGGLVAGALERTEGAEVLLIARASTASAIAEHGLRVQSVLLGDFVAHPRTVEKLQEPVDALIVATKASGLTPALERVQAAPPLVLPLLNGLDHLPVLRERFSGAVLAGTIRVEADRPEAGVIVHTSPFLRIDMATALPALEPAMKQLAELLTRAGVPARIQPSEAQVMWSKLVRLNALACTTSAYDTLLGEIRANPQLRAELVGAIEEASAVGRAEGAADVDAATAIAELEKAHETLGSSMQRDIAAGRAPELDAIPGSVLRAAARHGIRCPTIEALVRRIAARIGVEPPIPTAPG